MSVNSGMPYPTITKTGASTFSLATASDFNIDDRTLNTISGGSESDLYKGFRFIPLDKSGGFPEPLTHIITGMVTIRGNCISKLGW